MDTTRSQPVVFRNSAIRPGPAGLVTEGLREAWARRRLIRYLVQADVKKTGADTLLGNVWWVFDPLLQMIVYVILVTVIFSRSQPDYPLFVFSAILPWKWFTSSVNDSISSVVNQERLIKQLQFPKIVLPLAAIFAAVVHFLFGLIPLVALLALFYGHRMSPYVVLVLPIAGVQIVFSIAVALVLSALNVFVRDVGNISRHVLRLWFYLSPGLYAMTQLEKSSIAREAPIVIRLLKVNPFAILFESYRAVIYGSADTGPFPPDWAALSSLLAVSVVLVVLGVAFFKRLEPQFAKIL